MTDKGGKWGWPSSVTIARPERWSMDLKAPGSYSRDVKYNGVNKAQLVSLVGASLKCEQFIKYECHHTGLWFGTKPYGWWVSRDGQKMTYWGGATPGSGKCACAEWQTRAQQKVTRATVTVMTAPGERTAVCWGTNQPSLCPNLGSVITWWKLWKRLSHTGQVQVPWKSLELIAVISPEQKMAKWARQWLIMRYFILYGIFCSITN